ncbi:MAG: FHA domain-containing protein [Coriobacteriales bacterium]|nr:FHA domain-containing protein [Coriobacteriales bacterium]
MVDFVLLAGRILLVILLYIFLFAVMKTGIGLVKGQNKKSIKWVLTVEQGPKEIRGIKINVNSPIIVGRSPGSDILIASDVVSSRHARFSLMGTGLILEDLNSLNGTLLNGEPVVKSVSCQASDIISIGNAQIRVSQK